MEIVQATLPQRREKIRQLRDSGTALHHFQIKYMGSTHTLPVYIIDIGFPCYRLSNGRTRAAQEEIIVKKNLPSNFFTVDPDSGSALKEQDIILQSMVKQAGLLDILERDEQTQPIILDHDGYIVNGNRRICAMRLLLKKDEIKYQRFKHVQVIILPPGTERDILELEGRLQVTPEGRADYDWVNEAILFRSARQQKLSDNEIADLYKEKIKNIREYIAMLEEAELYLDTRNYHHEYSRVLDKEYAFKKIIETRKKCGDDEGKKQLMSFIAYAMIDDVDTAEGRLYKAIPEAYQHLEKISQNFIEELQIKSETPAQPSDDLDILGGTGSGLSTLITTLQQPIYQTQENQIKIREIIRNTISEMRDVERDRTKANYCRLTIQKSHTLLESAYSTLNEQSELTGIKESLDAIETTVNNIREWIKDVENNN